MTNLFFFLITAATSAPDGNLPGQLLVDTQAAVIEIDAVAGNRQLITLPSLRFELAIRAICGAAGRVESISVSAADTRQNYGVDDVNEQSIVNAPLAIPGQQLGPVRIGDFCRTPRTNSIEKLEMTIRGALTAQLSLRCLNEEEQSITYVSQPLDVVLRCNNVDEASIESPEGQESSAEPEPKL